MRLLMRLPMVRRSFGIHALSLLFILIVVSSALATDPQGLSDGQIIERAKSDWESGAFTPALEVLDQGIEANTEALSLHKLRGDILMTYSASHKVLRAYSNVDVKS